LCFRSKVYEGVAHILLAVAASIPAIAHAQGLAGTWIGRATYRGDDLPIELTFEITSSGPQGLLTAPTIRAHRYPLRNVALSTNEVSFDLVADASTFKFVGHVAGSTLMGTWNLFGVGAEVVATRGAARTVPYARESVSCRNGDVTLAGTLLVPSGPGPHPAVVFAHGSGPETRDASSFLADQLARRQIVVLTFDKRGTVRRPWSSLAS
jgi:hypothetical protein